MSAFGFDIRRETAPKAGVPAGILYPLVGPDDDTVEFTMQVVAAPAGFLLQDNGAFFYTGPTANADILVFKDSQELGFYRTELSSVAGEVDTVAPVLTSSVVTSSAIGLATGSIATTKAGPSWQVLTANPVPPTNAIIRAGTGAGVVGAASAVLVVGVNPSVYSYSGLPQGVELYPHTLQDDTVVPPNTSDVSTGQAFTTAETVVIPPSERSVQFYVKSAAADAVPLTGITGIDCKIWFAAKPDVDDLPDATFTGLSMAADGKLSIPLPTAYMPPGALVFVEIYVNDGNPASMTNRAMKRVLAVS